MFNSIIKLIEKSLPEAIGGLILTIILGIVGYFFKRRKIKQNINVKNNGIKSAQELVFDLIPNKLAKTFTFEGMIARTNDDKAGLALIAQIISNKTKENIKVIGRGPQWEDPGAKEYVTAVANVLIRKVRYERIMVIDSEQPYNTLLWLLLLERFMVNPDYRSNIALYPLPVFKINNITQQFQIVDDTWLHRTHRFYDSNGYRVSSTAESLFAISPHIEIRQHLELFQQHKNSIGHQLRHDQVVELLESKLTNIEPSSYKPLYHWELVLKVLEYLQSLDALGIPQKSIGLIGCLMPYTFTYRAASMFTSSLRKDNIFQPVIPLPFPSLDLAIPVFLEGKIDYVCVPIESTSLGTLLPPTLNEETLQYLQKAKKLIMKVSVPVNFVFASKSTHLMKISSIVAVDPSFNTVRSKLTGRLTKLPRYEERVESNYHAAWLASQDSKLGAITTIDAAEYLKLNILVKLISPSDGIITEFAIYSHGSQLKKI